MKTYKFQYYALLLFLWMICLLFLHCQQEINTEKGQILLKNTIKIIPSNGLKTTIGAFTDERDQQSYKWIKYDNGQKWMLQNLNFKMPTSTCYNGEENCVEHGQLYTWKEAMKACPKGWKLPSKNDWEELVQFFGGPQKAYHQLLLENTFMLSFGGVYDANKNKFNYKGLNGNYWTATKNRQLAWQYNFSKDYQKLFALQESIDLSFSCRCLKGAPEKSIAAIKKTRKKSENLRNAPVVTTSIIPKEGPIEPAKSMKIEAGIVQVSFHPSATTSIKLPILKREQLSSADLIIRKPNKVKTKERNAGFEIKHTGEGYCYGFLLEKNKSAQLIRSPLNKEFANANEADLIIAKPIPKKRPALERLPSHLIVEPNKPSVNSNREMMLFLTSTPIVNLETIAVTDKQQLVVAIEAAAGKKIIPLTATALTTEQNNLHYRLKSVAHQIFVFTLSIQE